MARFSMNRRLTFILALCDCLAWCSVDLRFGAALSGPDEVHAAAIRDGSEIGDPGSGGEGDPDVPDGPSKGGRSMSMTVQGGTNLEVRAAGDSRASNSAGWWRLRVVLESLRSFYLRF
jgi:hypothetical protein